MCDTAVSTDPKKPKPLPPIFHAIICGEEKEFYARSSRSRKKKHWFMVQTSDSSNASISFVVAKKMLPRRRRARGRTQCIEWMLSKSARPSEYRDRKIKAMAVKTEWQSNSLQSVGKDILANIVTEPEPVGDIFGGLRR